MSIKKITLALCTLTTLSISANVLAEGTIIGKFGTLGAGLEYVHPVAPKIAVGMGINGINSEETVEESNIDFDADFKMNTVSLLADFHPWESGFRISGGLMSNGNQFELEGTPAAENAEEVEINGKRYTADQVGSLKANVDFQSTAPYLGIGWGHAPGAGKGFAFDFDVGVLFQGEPNTAFTVVCNSNLDAADCATLQADADAQAATFKEDAKEFDMYPVVSMGVSYRF